MYVFIFVILNYMNFAMLRFFLTIFNGYIIKQLCQFSKLFQHNLGSEVIEKTFSKRKQNQLKKKRLDLDNEKEEKVDVNCKIYIAWETSRTMIPTAEILMLELRACLVLCLPKCGPWTTSITWECVRSAESHLLPQTYWIEPAFSKDLQAVHLCIKDWESLV